MMGERPEAMETECQGQSCFVVFYCEFIVKEIGSFGIEIIELISIVW